MTTAFYLKLSLLTVPVFFIIDMLWLGANPPGRTGRIGGARPT
jgi:hypothetical protein